MTRSSLRLLSPLLLALSACSVLVEGAIPEDPPPSDSCMGLADGTVCTREGIEAPLICLEGLCTNSRCGDGQLDLRPKQDGSAEICDDGNDEGSDGCEPDCTETVRCMADEDCADPEIACLEGVCDMESGECSIAESADGASCVDGDNSGMCIGGLCVAAGCGNGTMEAGEICDDGNTDAKDGCSPFCKPECLDNNACQQDVCLGSERCMVTTGPTGQIGICLPDPSAMVLDCDATCEVCDSIMEACVPSPGADADFDGHPSTTCGGDDCNDADPDINPGLAEICGDMIDSNCNGNTDEGAVSDWYADCDDDAYASSSALPVSSCGEPAGAPPECSAGDWTTRAPAGSAVDCLDTDRTVRPGTREFYASPYTVGRETSFDYNCDGVEEPEFRRVASPTTMACDRTCAESTVIGLTTVCGATATRYSCVESAGVCRRTANPLRYYLRCH